jgi:tryptophan halogenase
MLKNINKGFNFVVVGGGTAGWLSALYLKTYFPESNVSVIASSEIGILGAGEGTTAHFLSFLDEIGISVTDLIKHANATFKNGIKFTNWNGDKEHYHHPFRDVDDLDHSFYSDLNFSDAPIMDIESIANGKNLDNIDFSAWASEHNKVRYYPNIHIWNKKGDPFRHYDNLGKHGLHFDASLLAKYLQNVGQLRGISLIDSVVSEIIPDETGNIKKIKLENNYSVPCDFVFDCSGFSRLIIGKHYNSEWIDYKDVLPVNRALPFFIKNDSGVIPPYTESIAMKYGWMWKIPVQGRFGCGYVFDSSLISDEEAKKELEEYLGFNIEIPRCFSFSAGCYSKQWIKNCVAVGLSSGFIEPLEATSIWVTIMSLHTFMENLQGLTHGDQHSIDRYNNFLKNTNQKILDFLYFHYITKRTDTDFWKNFKKNNTMPEYIKNIIIESNICVPKKSYFRNNEIFPFKSWYHVGAGTKFFNQDHAQCLLDSVLQGSRIGYYKEFKEIYHRNIQLNSSIITDHAKLLSDLKNF